MEDLRAKAIAVAEATLADRFPEAACAFVAGSITRGMATPTSDIDLVVVFPRLDASWRESFYHEGVPIEVWAHDPETLRWFVRHDLESGYPIVAHMVVTGLPIGIDARLADTIQQEVRPLFEAGPQWFVGERLNSSRYFVTALLEDIQDARNQAELSSVAALLYQSVADMALWGRGAWSGKGKWVPRNLEATDRLLASRFQRAFSEAWQGRRELLADLVTDELNRLGGRYFAGDKRVAQAAWRIPAKRG